MSSAGLRPALSAFLAASAALALSGCGRRFVFVLDDTTAAVARPDAGEEPVVPLGTYAAQLDVPPCMPEARALVVDSASDDFDGTEAMTDPAEAGPRLTLREAIYLAANSEGPDNILFDPIIFPVDAPAVIPLEGRLPMNVQGPLCLDGRDRGVVVEWTEEGGQCGPGCMWGLRDGSLMVGLTLLNQPDRFYVRDAQIAGCRIGTDGHTASPYHSFWRIDAGKGTVVGPGNIFGGNEAVRLIESFDLSAAPQVFDNDFGYDPLTRRRVDLDVALSVRSFDIEARGNVFAAWGRQVEEDSQMRHVVTLRDNFVGVDRAGRPVPEGPRGPVAGLQLGGSFDYVIGPGNVIRGVETGVTGLGRVTRNTITGNGRGIAFRGVVPHLPPVLTRVSDTRVEGTCPVAGTVEVFADPGDQGQVFLGQVGCAAAGTWQLEALVPAGMNATATLTAGALTSAFSLPCAPGDACDLDPCAPGRLDADADGFAATACGGLDCDDGHTWCNPDMTEGPAGAGACTDGLDNDCDALVDAEDPGCEPTP